MGYKVSKDDGISIFVMQKIFEEDLMAKCYLMKHLITLYVLLIT